MKGFSVPLWPAAPFAQRAHLAHYALAAVQNLLLINFWEEAQFDCMFTGLSKPLPICAVFLSFLISPCVGKAGGREKEEAETPLQKVIMRKRMGMDGEGPSFWKCSLFLRASARRRTDVGTCGDRPHMLHPIHRHSDTATMVRLCARKVTKYINLCSPEHCSV